MDKERAQKIADDYCAKVSEYRRAIYSGEFGGGFLFRLSFQRSVHHGMPLFIIVAQGGDVEMLKTNGNIYYQAWDYSNDYLDSLNKN